jgi:hypothetical protein
MKKEDILANCIDEIRAGKSTLEDCLAKYPHLGDELPSLLKIAADIQPERVTPSEEFIKRTENRIFKEMQPSAAPAEPRGVDIFGWLKPLTLAKRTVAAIIISALLITGGTTAYAAQESLPDSALYPVKLTTEKARLAFTPSDAGKAKLHIAFAERRVQEMAEMGKRGKAEELAGLTVALTHHLEQAKNLTGAVAAEGIDTQELRVSLERSATRQLGILEAALDEVPEQIKPLVEQALQTSGEEYGTAVEVVGSTAPTPTLVTGVGTIQIFVTDPPAPNVANVWVEVSKIEVHRAAGPDSEWITIVDQPVTFDLLKIAEVQKFLGSQKVDAGTYTQLRMYITEAWIIDLDGEEHDAFVPSERLKFVRPFTIEDGEIKGLVLDFDGDKSLNVTGAGQYMLKPVVTLLVPEIEEEDEDEDEDEKDKTKVEIEGTVVSFDGDELVLLVAGQEVVIPLDTEAKIKGNLEEGSWAKVETVAEDGSFLAMEIEIEDTEEEIEEEEAEGYADKIREAEKEAAQKMREMEEEAAEEAEGEEGNEEGEN